MRRFLRFVLGMLPWLTIAGLLSAAFYIEPAGIGDAVTPPPIGPQDRFYGGAFVEPESVWLAGNQGKIVHSTDGGRTWSIQETGIPQNLQSIAAWDEEHLVAVGDAGTVLRTQDGGATWERVDVELPEIADKLLRVRILDGQHAWVVGEFGTILKISERGASWTHVSESRDLTLHDITRNNGALFAVGEFGTVMYSEDGGQTWRERSTPAPGTLNGVDFSTEDFGVAVGLDGMILVTEDGGENWRQVQTPTIEHLFAVRWTGRNWLAVGAQGVVLEASPAANEWARRSVAERDFAWRTEVVGTNDHWLLVGATSGFYGEEEWRPIAANGGGRS